MTSKEWWANLNKNSQSDSEEDFDVNDSDSRSAAQKSKLSSRKKLLVAGLTSLVLIIAFLLVQDVVLESTSLNDNMQTISLLKSFFENGGNLRALDTSIGQQASQGETTDSSPVVSPDQNESDVEAPSPAPIEKNVETTMQEKISPEPETHDIAPASDFGPELTSTDQISPSIFTDDNLYILMADPNKYVGYDATVTGEISGISYDDTYEQPAPSQVESVEMFKSRTAGSGQNLWIVKFGIESVVDVGSDEISVGDCLKIQGTVGGSAPSKTLGEKVVVLNARQVERIHCIDSAMPASHTIELESSKTIGDVTLAIKKVQFTAEHTRIELEAINTGINDKVFLRAKDSVALQDGKVYAGISHLPKFAEYRIDPVLTPDASITGYLFFEPIAYDSKSIEPIIFSVAIEETSVTEDKRSNFLFKIE